MSRVNIPNGSITTVRLANDAVVSSKIKEGAVRTEHLADGAVTNAKISLITPVKTSNDTTPATTEYVKTLIDDLVDSAPGSLDTLNEIALALNNDANLGSALTTAIASSVSAEAAARVSAVSAETAARASADSVISAAVSAEAAARVSAVSAEAAARASADSVISAAVSAEAAARASAVSAEAYARESADSVISAAVSAEAYARESADSVISAAVSAEAYARESADAVISAAVSAETAARASAVSAEVNNRNTAISAAVSAEVIERNTAISDAITSLVAGAPSALDTLNEIASALNNDDNLASTLTNLIGSVSAAVSTETVARASADSVISAAVSAEAYARESADSVISAAVSAETAARESAITSAVSAETAARASAITSAVSALSVLYDRFTQRGADIDGEAAGDSSGISVSISADGTIVAIGALDNDGNNNNNGHVRVYEYNGSSWVQRGADIDGKAYFDRNGRSVSISADGSIVAMGATGNDDNGNSSGHVRVYAWNGSNWVQRGADIKGEAADDESGWSVSISADGSIVAIGANGNNNNSGHVRVYAWNGSNWVQRGADIDGEAAGDSSGISVSISADGTIVAIGALDNDGNGTNSGHVRVYAWNGSIWVQRGADIDGEAASDQSGSSVSISADGSIVAIGALFNDGNGTNSGHVRVYAWNSLTSNWVKRGADIDGEAANDNSGRSVSISADGSIVAIGANGNNSYRGHVRVYAWNGSIWVKRGEDIDGEAAGDNSGRSVSISADGSIVAIGAIANNSYRGHVRVYEFNENVQTQIDTISAAVSAEAVARESADSVNSAAVSTEAAARESAVSAETVARESADSVISAAVSAEAVARASADYVISAAVSAEAVARESADSVISAAVSTEAAARESAISSAISGIATIDYVFELGLNNRDIVIGTVSSATNLNTNTPTYDASGNHTIIFSFRTKDLGINYSYYVYYALQTDPGAVTLVSTINGIEDVNSISIGQLTPNTTYILSVIIFNNARSMQISVSARTLEYTTPSAP